MEGNFGLCWDDSGGFYLTAERLIWYRIVLIKLMPAWKRCLWLLKAYCGRKNYNFSGRGGIRICGTGFDLKLGTAKNIHINSQPNIHLWMEDNYVQKIDSFVCCWFSAGPG